MTSHDPHQIMIAVGEPAQLTMLLAVAVPIARTRQGRVIPIYVGPTPSAPAWLDIPEEMKDVVAEPEIVDDEDISRAILTYARRLNPDLLLLHWKGRMERGRYLLGRTLDPLIQYAPCSVAVLRTNEDPTAFVERMASIERVLVPCGGGPNASLAISMALDFGPEVRTTALRVAYRNLGAAAISGQWELLTSVLESFEREERVEPHVTLASNVVSGIDEEANDGYDLMLIGATRESLVDRLLFGNLPQELAAKVSLPLIIVRRREAGPVAALRQVRWRILGILPQLTLEERTDIYRQVRRGSRASNDFYTMMVLSAGIASLGLLLNSSAVIIGAMLVAPLMMALLGVALGIVQGDVWLLRLALRTTLLGALLVVAVSSVFGLIMPDGRLTQEMLGRGSPTLLDLGVALFAGAAAAYAVARTDVSSALPGVAIAVALVPPLATIGLAAVMGERQVALGALLLFLTNMSAIISAGAIILLWMGFRPNSGQQAHARIFKGGILGTALLLGIVTVVLGALTASSVRESRFRNAVSGAVLSHLDQLGSNVQLTNWRVIDQQGDAVHIEVYVQSPTEVEGSGAAHLQSALAERTRRTVTLSLVVVPITRLDPVQPPAPASAEKATATPVTLRETPITPATR